MKRFIYISMIIIGCIFLLVSLKDSIGIDWNTIGMPRYDSSEMYYSDGFQDYTDYCKYFYNNKSVKKFVKNRKFTKVTEENIKNIKSYFENFEGWVDYQEYSDRYDFKLSQIKVNDYYYIIDKEGTPIGTGVYEKFDSYDVYYVDMENNIMYFIHSNI